ncbi:MAG: helix-turn-helix transcriptional regulator [Peptococcaceae bacterium]|nr:helix-turn-helix transcriptional regulator [Peptococcaceae bacterium]
MKYRQNHAIGKRIREARLKLGLTQEKLGERADVHYSYIGQVERGHKTPSINTLRKIAYALNIPAESLLLEETPEYQLSPRQLLLGELNALVRDSSVEDLRLFIDLITLLRSRLPG